MKIKDIALSAAYVGQRVVKAICVGAQEVWSAVKYIVFKDKAVEQICVANFSSDGVGVTEEDAAKVTDIGTIFQGNTEITSFDELNKFGVTELKANAFKGCSSLTKIGLENVEKIGGYCFDSSGITDVNCPKLTSFTSNVRVFSDTPIVTISNLGRITSLAGRTYNNEGMFIGCTSLRSVKLPPSLTALGGTDLFNGCTSLSSINLENVEMLGQRTFKNCIMLEIDYASEKIQKFDIEVFSGSGLKSVNCPNVTVIDWRAFMGSQLQGDISFPLLQTLNDTSFSGTKITSVSNLGQVTSISGSTYGGAFRDCKKLVKVVIPDTVTSIGEAVFSGCSSLEKILCHAVTPPALGSNAFAGTPSTMSIYVPDQSVAAYREASGWSANPSRIKPLSQYVES